MIHETRQNCTHNEAKMNHKIWGGRFSDTPAAIMEEINASIDFDHRLYAQDIMGSRAHCAMLVARGIINAEDGACLNDGLQKIEAQIAKGDFTFTRQYEDIHMNIENALSDMVGAVAGRLHTARSRNDQVATDFRLYVRAIIDRLCDEIMRLQRVLADLAHKHAESVMPGFTHLQPAQPITYGHYLLAYVEMLARDHARLVDSRKRVNISPLGAVALAGTSFPIDRDSTATALDFEGVMANSLDAVAARDFVLETLSACAILSTHLSRFAEEIVIFSNPAFGFFTLSDDFSTGSSIMPQKRNPDAAELVRAKCGRVIGALTSLFVVIKGLPLAYSKDMQEDKEPFFDATDSLFLCLTAMREMTARLVVDTEKMAIAARAGFSTATDLADWLVRVLDIEFRRAHHIVGAIVTRAEDLGVMLADLPLAEMQAIEPRITAGAYDVLTAEASVASRTSYGGTAPELVRGAAEVWQAHLKDT